MNFSPIDNLDMTESMENQSRFTIDFISSLVSFVKINEIITLALFFFFTYKIHLKTGNTF